MTEAPPRCRDPKRHEQAWRAVDGRSFCQTCETWKAMISVTVWEGGSPREDASRRTATVGAITLEELREMLPWAVANVLRAADMEPIDDEAEWDEDVG